MRKLNFWVPLRKPKWHTPVSPLIHLPPPPPEILKSDVLDVDEFTRTDLVDRADDDIVKRTQSNYGLEAESSHAVIPA